MVPRGELLTHLTDAARRPDLVIIARVNVAVRVLPIVRPSSRRPGDFRHRGSSPPAFRARSGPPRAAPHRCTPSPEDAGARDGARQRSGMGGERGERQALLAEEPRLRVGVLSNIPRSQRSGSAVKGATGWASSWLPPPRTSTPSASSPSASSARPAARADVVLAVIGADIPAKVHALEGPGVGILGHGATRRTSSTVASVVAPIRYGAGVKGELNSRGGPPATIAAEGGSEPHDLPHAASTVTWTLQRRSACCSPGARPSCFSSPIPSSARDRRPQLVRAERWGRARRLHRTVDTMLQLCSAPSRGPGRGGADQHHPRARAWSAARDGGHLPGRDVLLGPRSSLLAWVTRPCST